MDSQQIKKLISWLKERVLLVEDKGKMIIRFDEPTVEDFNAAGFDDEMISMTLKAPWWGEMVTDIIETPDFAAPDDTANQILGYAHDVVYEYVGKRILL